MQYSLQNNELTLNPVPSILIESLRDIGYTFKTALADIVDNSLAAGATEIQIEARAVPSPAVGIIDNGAGLTRDELFDSMRMGSRDPKQTRNSTDLGRFGLGMKTASFSQCRRLTVVSRQNGVTTAFTWDLDRVVELNEWKIQEITDLASLPFYELLQEQGTIVIWEKLDRVYGEENDPAKVGIILSRYMDQASEHLSLVFHRFLGLEKGYKTIKMWLNGGPIKPLDPFVTNHSATIAEPIEPMPGGVTIQAFTLPHASKYRRKADYERNGLSGGYIKSQGIYLYRARRLIIYGTWFGLTKKSTLTQLCRVRIDIDNSHDEEWKIDVKKASAQLPENVRMEVKNLIDRFKSPSVRVYKRRGTKQVSSELHPVWNSQVNGSEIKFRINRSHPVIQSCLENLSGQDRDSIELLLKLIESGFPKDALFYELSKNPEDVETPKMETSDVLDVAKRFYVALKANGQDDEHILDVMSSMEMFDERWEEISSALGIEGE